MSASVIKLDFKEAEGVTGVPYVADLSAGRRNNGFIDLLSSPERIAEIHELGANPRLRDLVIALNSGGSAYFTIGCEQWIQSSEIKRLFARQQGSYVQLAFRDFEKNRTPEPYLGLYGRFRKSISLAEFSAPVGIRFELKRASYTSVHLEGWSLTIWNFGYGATKPEARANWSKSIEAISNFLLPNQRSHVPLQAR